MLRIRSQPLALLACAAACLAAPARADEILVDGIAAQVGSSIVLVSEVLRNTAPVERQMREAGASETDVAKLRARALEHLIEARLIESVVERAELYASDEEVNGAIDAIAAENGLSPEQLRASVRQHGLSYDEYRQQIKRDLERRKVVNAMVGSKVRVEEEDVRQLYQQRFGEQPEGGAQVHVRQILVTFGGDTGRDEPSACALVRGAARRIAAGEPFAEVASQVSVVAPQTGGDIGWLHQSSLAGWMADAIASLEAGQVSDLVRLPFGCTLLQLVERRDYERITLERARPMLESEVFEAKMTAEFRKWLESVRDRTFIERRGFFADAAQFGESPFESSPGTSQNPQPPSIP